LVLSLLGQAIVLIGAFQYLRGGPVRAGECLHVGLGRLVPLLGLSVLYLAGLGVGFVLLVVPAIVLTVLWTVVVPACVVEGLGPWSSIVRSTRLTRGYRWKIFGALAVTIIVGYVASEIAERVLEPAGLHAVALVRFLIGGAWGSFANCLEIMIYHDLRVAKEHIETAQIASVFD
jgi:hypothetical protein